MSELKSQIQKAEINARKRDREIENENYIDLKTVDEVEKKANSLGYGLYKKNNKNQARFTQTINDNWDILIKQNYLTGSELTFLMSITALVEFDVNAIAHRDTGQFMNVSEIARYLGRSRSRVSNVIKSLIDKGVIFEFVNIDELLEFRRNVTPRSLFLNPELIYAGDRNKIDGTLAMLVTKYDKLEKNNILLEWKVWRKPGERFGKLYRRKTYLNYKKKYS
mgnify:CR=1 FL=1